MIHAMYLYHVHLSTLYTCIIYARLLASAVTFNILFPQLINSYVDIYLIGFRFINIIGTVQWGTLGSFLYHFLFPQCTKFHGNNSVKMAFFYPGIIKSLFRTCFRDIYAASFRIVLKVISYQSVVLKWLFIGMGASKRLYMAISRHNTTKK